MLSLNSFGANEAVSDGAIAASGRRSLSVARVVRQFPLLFLMAIALVPRLYNLTSPVIGVHSWRQADTAAIARNFYEMQLAYPGLSNVWRFLYPQVDWGGGGYAETEFPLYPAVASWVYRLLGEQIACARFVTVLFSLLGLYFLYRLIALCFDRSVAFWSALFYALLPLSVFYGRTVQPESLVMMSTLGGLYFFKRWTVRESWRDLAGSWVFSAIALLTKVLPLIYLGIPLLFLAVVKYRGRVFRRWELWVYAIALLAVTFAWYYHARQIYLDTGLTFGFWSDDTDRYSWTDLLSLQYWLDILLRLVVRHYAIFGFLMVLVGLTYRRRKLEDYLWEVGLVSSLLANALAPTSSYIHEYYQLPLMLYGLVFVGKVFGQTFSLDAKTKDVQTFSSPAFVRWASRPFVLKTVLVLSFLAGSIIYGIDYMQPERLQASEVYQLAQQIAVETPPDAKVLATTGGDPTLLYLSHRKGWLAHPEDISPESVASAKLEGADFLVGSYEIVQSYAPFEDESQKETIRQILAQFAAESCQPAINNSQVFVSAICP